MKIYNHRKLGFGAAMLLIGIVISVTFFTTGGAASLKENIKAMILAVVFLIAGAYFTVLAFSSRSAVTDPMAASEDEEKRLEK